ncbi:MAG: hypothetical protein C0423_17235 [Methylibium sp.]|nr:hypothetical protein [Methylibium sp.]
MFPLDPQHMAAGFWPQFSKRVLQWLDSQGLSTRDAVLLLPFAQHLAPARRAWMQLGRWQPRIETTHSLASALGPKLLPQPLQISFDAAIDALSARSLLQGQSWAQALRRRDSRAFDLAVLRLVEAAHAWARAASQRAPGAREAFWSQAREALTQSGPGALERALAMVALEWAASDGRAPATDALFELRPSAWVLLQCGGPEPLANSVLDSAELHGMPVLRLSADLSLEEAFATSPPPGLIEQAVCDDFESLAQCSAAAVLQHLQLGRQPVALIAQDRVLIRRVRTLLERQSVAIGDETGWMLATLPQATQLTALLRAARPQASLDDWLGCMKSELAADLSQRYGAAALSALELQCRKRGWSSPAALQPAQLSPGSARLWSAVNAALEPLSDGAAVRPLADWLSALAETLQRLGATAQLESDPAGAQLLDALWLRRSPWPGSAHEAVMQQARLAYGEFVAWVEATLEAAQFVPAATGPVAVLITPLARAMLRPFAAVVLPGADAVTLGPVPAGPALLNDGLAAQLGMPTLAAKREGQALIFAQLLRVPALTLLRCHSRGQGPLAPSPLLERLEQALQVAGLPPPRQWQDARGHEPVQTHVVQRAQAVTPGLLPARLSASALESLRQCPYQFFARVMLGLREQDELEAPLDKRDYGTWLHAVLHQFHELRAKDPGAESDIERLQAAAQQQMQELGLSEAEFLPFLASFERFIPSYLEWLSAHEEGGARYQAGELAREIKPFAPLGQPLQELLLGGRIDRVDTAGGAQLLIDYKTGSVAGLKDKVATPSEDTQLAVYALLMGAEAEGGEQQALYLALDESKGVDAVIHPDVGDSAALLVDGLADDLLAMHAGLPLPALGEGAACDYCEMRGLCRRDDWTGSLL